MEHINNIAENLLASKVGLIPKFLFNKKQINIIRNMLSIQNINLQLDEHVYNILTPSCYTFNTKLLFRYQ